MIILIGGESHTGKTFMAQKLLEKYHIPYTSIDHIKMGLIRGCDKCDFKVSDNDNEIADKLWGIINGIIDTCKENEQNIILEGFYLPPEKVRDVLCNEVICVYIIFSEEYIKDNFYKIISFENVIEKRKFKEERKKDEFIILNKDLKRRCLENKLPYFEIKTDYKNDIQKAYDYIDRFYMCN